MRNHSSSSTASRNISGASSSEEDSRNAATSAAIAQLQSIPNMRDLAEACPGIQPGRVFRSACPNVATRDDIRLLRQRLGIQQLVRPMDERRF